MRQLAICAKVYAKVSRARGFTLFEFAVSATIVALLTALLLQRLPAWREQAELAAVARIAAVLRTALAMKSGELRHAGREAHIAALAGANPFDLLLERPSNYLGDYFAPDTRSLAAGSWYFDKKVKSLVY